MFRNNVIALLLHFLLILLSTIYLIALVSLSPIIGIYMINPFIRGALVLLWIGAYFLIGTKLTIRHSRKFDFSGGLVIALFGLILWVFGLYKTGMTFGALPEELTYHFIPLNVYLNPILQICFLLNIEFNQVIRLVANFIPSILIGIGLKYKRLRASRRRYKATS